MGYSYAAKAGYVMDAIGIITRRDHPEIECSNSFPGGFYEYGREQDDGAITGTVFKTIRVFTDAERIEQAKLRNIPNPSWVGDPCKRAGSFRIEPTGKITRFPMISKAVKAEAEKMAAGKYGVRHVAPYTVEREASWDQANGWTR